MTAWAGQRVVVGGTSGMGLATVRAALAHGAEVVAAGRCPSVQREAASGVRHDVADVTNEESVRALFETAGELDHLFVSASPGSPGAFLKQDLAAARSYMDGKFSRARCRPGGWVQRRISPTPPSSC